jgi:hypothetical protein
VVAAEGNEMAKARAKGPAADCNHRPMMLGWQVSLPSELK